MVYHFFEGLAIQHGHQGSTVHHMVTMMSFVETTPTSYCANAHSVPAVFSAPIMSSTLPLSKVLEGGNGVSWVAGGGGGGNGGIMGSGRGGGNGGIMGSEGEQSPGGTKGSEGEQWGIMGSEGGNGGIMGSEGGRGAMGIMGSGWAGWGPMGYHG